MDETGVPPRSERDELRSLREAIAEQTQRLQSLRQLADEQERALRAIGDQLEIYADQWEIQQHAPASSSENETYKLALALTLANAAYDALIVVDEQARIIAINNSAEILFGRQRPIGERLVDVTTLPELEAMVMDALQYQEEVFEEQISYQKRAYRVRTQLIRRDGSAFIGLALQDVTELVRLNRARRDMVANISHELRTPIANIRLSIDSLFHEQDKPKRKASISALKAIARETDSLLWLVQELYDLSMIESGQSIMRLVETPLRQIVDEAFERMEDLGEEKQIQLVTHVPSELMVLIDRDQVRRVFINLIHNALKFSPMQGSITVEAVANHDDVMVSVFDEGPGVPDEHVDRIFERFYQVDTARSGNEGTGLGLAICKHIVEAHDGRIWAEGNHNGERGGRFFFTLPLAMS